MGGAHLRNLLLLLGVLLNETQRDNQGGSQASLSRAQKRRLRAVPVYRVPRFGRGGAESGLARLLRRRSALRFPDPFVNYVFERLRHVCTRCREGGDVTYIVYM